MLNCGFHFCADFLLSFLVSQKQVDGKRVRGIEGSWKGKMMADRIQVRVV